MSWQGMETNSMEINKIHACLEILDLADIVIEGQTLAYAATTILTCSIKML